MSAGGFHSIQGPAGALQVLEEHPETERGIIAVICHPHPLHGGTLTNKVVHQIARTFLELGAISVRFNFRGVGESGGQYDNGAGEVQDLVAVTRWAQQRWPARKLWLAGFSFGGSIAIKAVPQLEPDWLVTAAPAINFFPAADFVSPENWLLVQGGADDIVPAEQVLDWVDALDTSPQLRVLEGAGHFFHGRLNDVKQVIMDAADRD